MQERCKNAAKLLKELGTSTARLPFVFCPSKKIVPTMKSDPKLGNRSPLIMSDTNAQFLFQVKYSGCRDALQANPLRNISPLVAQFGRNLGLDVNEISQRVQRSVEIEQEKALCQQGAAGISGFAVNPLLKKGDRSTQTKETPCMRCHKRDTTKFESRSSQVKIPGKETGTQYDEEPDSFNVSLNARTMRSMTPVQQLALVNFCQAFNIQDERLEGAAPIQNNRVVLQREPEDRMAYTNPENPNVSDNVRDDTFVSFSPERESPPPPRLGRITDRLGERVQSPEMQQQFHDDDDAFSGEYYRQPQFTYRIPSPQVIQGSRHNRSPLYPVGYNNRPRSRSTSPTFDRRRRSRTRSKSPGPFAHRRGRY